MPSFRLSCHRLQIALDRARIESVSGYSSHADQQDLLNFVRRMRHPPREIRLVHGDPSAQAALKATLLEWAEGAGHKLEVTLGADHLAVSTHTETITQA